MIHAWMVVAYVLKLLITKILIILMTFQEALKSCVMYIVHSRSHVSVKSDIFKLGAHFLCMLMYMSMHDSKYT